MYSAGERPRSLLSSAGSRDQSHPRAPADHTHESYVSFLRERAGKIFYRLPYPGNAGDSLIQFATQRILDDLKICTTVNPRQAEVILVPGGNPSMWPSIGAECWKSLWSRYPQAEFIIGPAGFREGSPEWAQALNQAGDTVTGLFARDPESFENLRRARPRSGIFLALSHDPALYLRNSEWVRAHRLACSEEYHLAAFRDDHEANLRYPSILRRLRKFLPGRVHHLILRQSAMRARASNLKQAKMLSNDGMPLHENDASRQRFEVFVEIVRAARTVHTDRLHVLLLAAMLGKKVFAYPTSHAKLESVYRHSLTDWADVIFV